MYHLFHISLTKIILPLQSYKRILMVCTSCKTSFNVLSHSHVINEGLDHIGWSGLGDGGFGRVDIRGGGGNAKE